MQLIHWLDNTNIFNETFLKIGKIKLQTDWLISSDGCFKFNKGYHDQNKNDLNELAVIALYHYQTTNYDKLKYYTWHIRFQYNLKYLHDPFAAIYNTNDATIKGTERQVKDLIDQFLFKMSKFTSFV